MVPLLFTELLTRQMGICTVSFRHLSRVWCRVESLSSLCSQRIHFEGRREREAIPETQTGACGKQPGWEGSSVFKEGPWINWIPKQRLHTANSAAHRHLQCSRSVSWNGIFLFAACDGFGGVGGLGRGGTSWGSSWHQVGFNHGMQLHSQYNVTRRLERDFSQGLVVMGQGGMALSWRKLGLD